MKKILVQAYTEKNFGDDLFLKLLFDRYPNVEWILDNALTEYKEIFKKYNNVSFSKNYIYKLLSRFNHGYFEYDALLYIGGSIFIQDDEFWKKQLNERKRMFKIFKNKAIFVLGANFGPFKDNLFLQEYIKLLKQCKDVCFRDAFSLELFGDLENIRVNPDIVFQLNHKKIIKDKNSIGISLISLKNRKELIKHDELYKMKMIELIERCIENGKKIYLFSFCQREGDLDIINFIINNINKCYKKYINIVSYDGDIDTFLTKFGSMQNIIGARFHSCILSQVFEQGLYPLIYSNKTYNMLCDIGLNKEYTYINNIENLNIDHVLEIIDNNKIIDKNIFKDAYKQFEVLDSYVSEK